MRKRLVIAIVSILLLGIPARGSTSTSDEAGFVSRINEERAARGIRTLTVRGDLVEIARRHSARMAADGTIYHNKNLGNEVSGNWYALGENVGMGPTVESLHEAFMASAPHRRNILDRDYNQIGVGVVIKDDTIYVTEVFAGRSTPRPRSAKPARGKAPVAKSAARPPAPAEADPLTIPILLRLLGMDAKRIDPASGAALGV